MKKTDVLVKSVALVPRSFLDETDTYLDLTKLAIPQTHVVETRHRNCGEREHEGVGSESMARMTFATPMTVKLALPISPRCGRLPAF